MYRYLSAYFKILQKDFTKPFAIHTETLSPLNLQILQILKVLYSFLNILKISFGFLYNTV